MTQADYVFLDRPGYLGQLAERVSRTVAGDRIAISTMSYDARVPLVRRLMEELAAAAGRQVDVLVIVDAYSFMHSDDTPLPGPMWYAGVFPSGPLHAPYIQAYEALETLRKAGGTYRIINRPEHPLTLPYAGRSHIKEAVVNDWVALGGHNLESPEELDIMVSMEHPKIAGIVYGLAKDIAEAGNVRTALSGEDRHFLVDDRMDLYVDAGVRNRSLIRDQALALVDGSEEWVLMTSQYFPGGHIGRHLRRAREERNVRVRSVYSHPRAQGNQRMLHELHLFAQRLRLPKEAFEHQMPADAPKVHAKLLATEKGAMLGSHNYVDQGVLFGTAEIALRVMDPAFSRDAIAAMDKLLESGRAATS